MESRCNQKSSWIPFMVYNRN